MRTGQRQSGSAGALRQRSRIARTEGREHRSYESAATYGSVHTCAPAVQAANCGGGGKRAPGDGWKTGGKRVTRSFGRVR